MLALDNKERFIQLCTEHIKRPGIDKLLEWLETTDFYTAPSSTKYHGSCQGGLLQHSLNVFDRLVAHTYTVLPEADRPSLETVAIVALFHDLCKVDFYDVEFRNRKNEQGQWEKYPCYVVNDRLPFGHGEKSVYMLSGFMRLSREEAFAIRFHMGDYSDLNTGKAFSMFPLALLTHQADELAAHIDEVEPA